MASVCSTNVYAIYCRRSELLHLLQAVCWLAEMHPDQRHQQGSFPGVIVGLEQQRSRAGLVKLRLLRIKGSNPVTDNSGEQLLCIPCCDR